MSLLRPLAGLLALFAASASAGPRRELTPNPAYAVPAAVLADWLVQCQYSTLSGVFNGEDLWQSGNTLDSLAQLTASSPTTYAALMNNTYLRTPPVVDNCFDDHQWWLHGWVTAYETTGEVEYLERAAQAFSYVVQYGWSEDVCGGGVMWCPVQPGQSQYKNAITNELFFTAAARLNVHAGALPSFPGGYFLGWATRAWSWFEGAGLVNAGGLVNDGLNATCVNNGQTTWTYNQGVLLDGLGLLAQVTGNATLLSVATRIADATMAGLTDAGGVLVEPCGASCNGDQHIFKGVFVRHLGRLLQQPGVDPTFSAHAAAFLTTNADSVLANAACRGGGYGVLWQGPCTTNDTATASAALDALTAAATLAPTSARPGTWDPLGVGNCVDSEGNSMANCWATGVAQSDCAAASAADPASRAYDFMTKCDASTFCRVRTTGGAAACPLGWSFTPGTATAVTASNGAHLTVCVSKR